MHELCRRRDVIRAVELVACVQPLFQQQASTPLLVSALNLACRTKRKDSHLTPLSSIPFLLNNTLLQPLSPPPQLLASCVPAVFCPAEWREQQLRLRALSESTKRSMLEDWTDACVKFGWWEDTKEVLSAIDERKIRGEGHQGSDERFLAQ
eukprot:2337585-Rhodomonas_salina.2